MGNKLIWLAVECVDTSPIADLDYLCQSLLQLGAFHAKASEDLDDLVEAVLVADCEPVGVH